MTRTIAAACAALALLLTACGGGGDEGVADQQTTAPATDAGEAAGDPAVDPAGESDAAAPEGDAVTVQGFRFQPATLQVAAGATVTWTNQDDIDHTATAGTAEQPGGDFDISLAEKGATGSHTFNEPGTYAYFCRVHESMTGEVVVS